MFSHLWMKSAEVYDPTCFSSMFMMTNVTLKKKTRAKYFIIFRRLTHNLKHKFSNFFSLYQKPWFNVLSCKQLVFTWITNAHPRSHEASDCMYREMNVDKDICCIRCKCHSGLIICTKCHLASDEHVKCRGEDFSQLLCNLLCMCDFN